MRKHQDIFYSSWNDNVPQEPGFTKEMISSDTPPSADLDSLEMLPFPGVDTLSKAFQRTVSRIPNNNWLGVREGNSYENNWISFKTAAQIS